MFIKVLQKLGWLFFCKIGDPIFSPSQAAVSDAVCLWCGKQHGKLTNKFAWAFMSESFVQALTHHPSPSDIMAEGTIGGEPLQIEKSTTPDD